MTKAKTNKVKNSKAKNVQTKVCGLYSLIVALAQLAAGYVFVFDGRPELMVVGGILTLASVITLANRFLK